MIKTLLIIGLGGFIGSITRYAIYHYFAQNYSSDYPWGTFAANLIGCFILGLIFGFVANGNGLNQALVFFLTTGFCGALTTFSTFSFENVLLLQRGELLVSFIYAGLSLTVGLLFTWLGLSSVKIFV